MRGLLDALSKVSASGSKIGHEVDSIHTLAIGLRADLHAALRRLGDEARGSTNLMPAIMDAVKAYATLGEINRAMKDVFGEHKEPVKF